MDPIRISKTVEAVMLVLVISTTGCAQVSPERLSALKAEIEQVRTEIKLTEADDARYSGGLVKSVIALRLATLRQTEAMLKQLAESWTFGIGLKYTVDGKLLVLPPTSKETLAGVEREVADADAQIERQKLEVSRYTGGLVQAMSLATLATLQQSRAMLDQKRLALKYELPQFIGFTDAFSTHAGPPVPARNAAELPQQEVKNWEIVSIGSRVTESNNTWWKYAWRLVVRNKSAMPQRFEGVIEFQDKDGFIVDTSPVGAAVVAPNSEADFTGYALVTAKVAPSIAQTLAKVRKVP